MNPTAKATTYDFSQVFKFSILIFLILAFSQLGLAQTEPCGFVAEPFANYADFKSSNSLSSRSDYTLPVKFHVITEDNGNCNININDLVNEFMLTKSYFQEVGIDLQLCGIDYIKDSGLYNFNIDMTDALASTANKPEVINVYITEILENNSGVSICGRASSPWGSTNLILIKASCATNGSTMAHEFGHTLGLYHTHTTTFGEELVNRSNCESTGDMICDTPADPKLSPDLINEACSYTGDEKDNNGDLYQPSPKNIMSYSRKDCRKHFTDMQGQIMRNFHETYYADYKCEDSSFGSEVLVFPNPATDFIAFVLFEDVNFEVSIYDMKGSLIKNWINQSRIPLDYLLDGVYILEIDDKDNGRRTVKKVIVKGR